MYPSKHMCIVYYQNKESESGGYSLSIRRRGPKNCADAASLSWFGSHYISEFPTACKDSDGIIGEVW